MPDLDQGPEVPVGFTGRNGFNVWQVMGSIRARGIKLAILEILCGIVAHGLYKIRQRRLGSRQLGDKVQFRTLCAIRAVILCEQQGQARLG